MNRGAVLIPIAMIHHPVHMNGPEDETLLRLDDSERVARRLAASGVNLVLSGHVHVCRLYEAASFLPAQFIAGSAAQFRGPKNYLAIDIYDSGFDPHEYGMSPDNQFLEFMEEQTQTPPPCS